MTNGSITEIFPTEINMLRVSFTKYTSYIFNNIYDMAGNTWGWTNEIYSSDYRVYRSGHYDYSDSSYPASYRDNNYLGSTGAYLSSRALLYIL